MKRALVTGMGTVRLLEAVRREAHDAPVLYGSHARLAEASGWRPEIPLEQTVRDTLDWWRRRLRS